MRLYSTRESVRAGEPTVLAIVETLLAMAASVWVGVHFGTWWHVWIGAVVAPLTLLRTTAAAEHGWDIARRLRVWCRRKATTGQRVGFGLIPWAVVGPAYLAIAHALDDRWILRATVLSVGTAMASPWEREGAGPLLIGRLAGVLRGVWAQPAASVRAVPGNWKHVVFAEDSATPAQVLPLEKLGVVRTRTGAWTGTSDSGFAIRVAVRRWLRPGRWGKLAFVLLFWTDLIAELLVFVLPAMAFRYGIKSTAIIWVPILWALKPPKPQHEPWAAHLKLLARGDLMRLVVGFSVLTLVLMLGKYLLLWAGQDLAVKGAAGLPWVGDRLAEFLDAFLRPGEVPIWQVSAAVNAVLAITAWMLARHWLLRAESGLAINEPGIDRKLGWMLGVRRVLTSYAIVCNFYAAWHLAQKMPLPSIGSKLFPWL